MDTKFYRINAGHLAVKNGAISPLSQLFAFAEIIDSKVITGQYYGQDYIPVPSDPIEKEIAEELLNESKLIWEIVDELPRELQGYF